MLALQAKDQSSDTRNHTKKLWMVVECRNQPQSGEVETDSRDTGQAVQQRDFD